MLSKVVIYVIGNNNQIVIGDQCELVNCILRTDGNNNQIVIGQNSYIGGAYIHGCCSTMIKLEKATCFLQR